MAYKPVAGATVSTPNVVPMCDIMLVLLIIFMVVTPMLQKTHQVDLAPTNNAHEMKDADRDDAVVVAVTRDGTLYLQNNRISKESITNEVKDQIANRLDKTVYVKADARAKYGDVVAVVDEIRAAGVDQLGLLTQKVGKQTSSPQAQATSAAGGQI
jgi:biopolymer transport protein ExbD/biopolymer transport protein TolR